MGFFQRHMLTHFLGILSGIILKQDIGFNKPERTTEVMASPVSQKYNHQILKYIT